MATPYHNNTCEKCGKMGATVFAGSPTKICATCHGATVREKLQARKAERADARAERKAEKEEKKLAKAASKEVSTVLQVQGELPASVGDAIDMSHNRLAISQNCRTIACKEHGRDPIVWAHSRQAGKWYYEVTVVQPVVLYIGWVRSDATVNFARGIGSDETSWAVDVSLSRFLHNGEATPLERLGDLKIGDVISIGIDLDTFTICVQKGAEPIAVPAAATRSLQSAAQLGLRPALSLSTPLAGTKRSIVNVNLGESPWKFPPPMGFLGLCKTAPDATPPPVFTCLGGDVLLCRDGYELVNLHPEENALVLFDAIRMVHDPRTFAFEVKLLAANALKRAITGTHSQIGWLKVPLPPAPSKSLLSELDSICYDGRTGVLTVNNVAAPTPLKAFEHTRQFIRAVTNGTALYCILDHAKYLPIANAPLTDDYLPAILLSPGMRIEIKLKEFSMALPHGAVSILAAPLRDRPFISRTPKFVCLACGPSKSSSDDQLIYRCIHCGVFLCVAHEKKRATHHHPLHVFVALTSSLSTPTTPLSQLTESINVESITQPLTSSHGNSKCRQCNRLIGSLSRFTSSRKLPGEEISFCADCFDTDKAIRDTLNLAPFLKFDANPLLGPAVSFVLPSLPVPSHSSSASSANNSGAAAAPAAAPPSAQSLSAARLPIAVPTNAYSEAPAQRVQPAYDLPAQLSSVYASMSASVTSPYSSAAGLGIAADMRNTSSHNTTPAPSAYTSQIANASPYNSREQLAPAYASEIASPASPYTHAADLAASVPAYTNAASLTKQQPRMIDDDEESESVASSSSSSSLVSESAEQAAAFKLDVVEVAKDQHLRQWNEEFQRIQAQPANTPEKQKEKLRALNRFSSDFVAEASRLARIVVDEVALPREQKTIAPKDFGGIAGGSKFFENGIFMKFASDLFGIYGGESLAMKAASHELNGLRAYFEANIEGLSQPMMCLVDYKGWRVICTCGLPLGKDSLRYGSSDAAMTVHADDPILNEKMKQAAKVINMKGHRVGRGGKLVELFAPADIEAHRGTDNRYYVLDTARVFPPEPTWKTATVVVIPADALNSVVWQEQNHTAPRELELTMRNWKTELVRVLQAPSENDLLSTPAGEDVLFSVKRQLSTSPAVLNIRASLLVEKLIYGDAAIVFSFATKGKSLHALLRGEALRASPVPLSSDAYTSFGMDNRLEHNREVLQAYQNILGKEIPTFVSFFQSRELLPVTPAELSMMMHANGLNMRYLGRIRGQILASLTKLKSSTAQDESTNSSKLALRSAERLVLISMVTRLAKHSLRHWMRKCAADPNALKDSIAFYFNLLLGNSSASDYYWSHILRILLIGKYGKYGVVLTKDELEAPNLKSHLNLSLLPIFHSLMSASGIVFRAEFVANISATLSAFDVASPFSANEIERVDVRTRTLTSDALRSQERKLLSGLSDPEVMKILLEANEEAIKKRIAYHQIVKELHPRESRSVIISSVQLVLLQLSSLDDNGTLPSSKRVEEMTESLSAAEIAFEKLPMAERTLELAAGIFYIKGLLSEKLGKLSDAEKLYERCVNFLSLVASESYSPSKTTTIAKVSPAKKATNPNAEHRLFVRHPFIMLPIQRLVALRMNRPTEELFELCREFLFHQSLLPFPCDRQAMVAIFGREFLAPLVLLRENQMLSETHLDVLADPQPNLFSRWATLVDPFRVQLPMQVTSLFQESIVRRQRASDLDLKVTLTTKSRYCIGDDVIVTYKLSKTLLGQTVILGIQKYPFEADRVIAKVIVSGEKLEGNCSFPASVFTLPGTYSAISIGVNKSDHVFFSVYASAAEANEPLQITLQAHPINAPVLHLQWLIGKKVRQVSLGQSYSIAVMASGEVYGWGSNDFGQLGLGHRNAIVPEPVLVTGLTGRNVVRASSPLESKYTLVLTAEGEVYSFGFGGDGCLALGDTEDRITPRLVEALSGKPVESICAGRRAMFVILKATGAIWSSGQSPANGDTTGLRLVPEPISTLAHRKFRTVVNSVDGYLALAQNGQDLFYWGSFFDQRDVSPPQTVHLEWHQYPNERGFRPTRENHFVGIAPYVQNRVFLLDNGGQVGMFLRDKISKVRGVSGLPRNIPFVSLHGADNTALAVSEEGKAFVIGGIYSACRLVDALENEPVYVAAIRSAEEHGSIQPARVCCVGQRPEPHRALPQESFNEAVIALPPKQDDLIDSKDRSSMVPTSGSKVEKLQAQVRSQEIRIQNLEKELSELKSALAPLLSQLKKF